MKNHEANPIFRNVIRDSLFFLDVIFAVNLSHNLPVYPFFTRSHSHSLSVCLYPFNVCMCVLLIINIFLSLRKKKPKKINELTEIICRPFALKSEKYLNIIMAEIIAFGALKNSKIQIARRCWHAQSINFSQWFLLIKLWVWLFIWYFDFPFSPFLLLHCASASHTYTFACLCVLENLFSVKRLLKNIPSWTETKKNFRIVKINSKSLLSLIFAYFHVKSPEHELIPQQQRREKN